MKYVIKRDGSRVPFDMERIYGAVEKAFRQVRNTGIDGQTKRLLDGRFLHYRDGNDEMGVEQIQDAVERVLMTACAFDVAKAYILYRAEHADIRLLKERADYIDSYVTSRDNAAGASEADPNANVAIKNVANLDAELWKSKNRPVQRINMRKWLRKLHPELEMQYERDLKHHILYAHDESGTAVGKPYCNAVSMFPFMLNGTSGLDGVGSGAPNNLNGFAGQFVNMVFLLSSQCRGAVAFGEFFNCMAYYCRRDFGEGWVERVEETAHVLPHRTIRQVIEQTFQHITHSINQPAGNRSFQSPFTNFAYYDRYYWQAMFADFAFPDGTRPQWEEVSWLQKNYMKWLNRERLRTLLTFPVETMALLHDGHDVLDKEYKEFTAEMYAEGHSFFTYLSDNPDSLASCCRLRNEVRDNVFSFTNGLTGVQTGSANVITLNINRIIQDWAREKGLGHEDMLRRAYDRTLVEESFAAYLKGILGRVYCYQEAYKEQLYYLERNRMLTPSDAGFIQMSRLYSTIGVNGVNEAAEFLGLECTYNDDYRHFCNVVTGTISSQNKAHSRPGLLFNQEFVPAETLSSKNCNWDRKDGYWVPEGRILYNSYFYRADDRSVSVLDKFRLHGREFTGLLDGGVGLHCNLSEHLSKKQYLHLIDFAIEQGTSYFTFNVPNSKCTDCGYIVKTPLEKCPKCGGEMIHYTRIIGYLVPVRNFDAYRRREEATRYYAAAKEVENNESITP